MWLRLFGRGAVQGKAVNEVLTLEENDNQRNEALRLLSTWRISIDVAPQEGFEDLEFKMIVSKAYQEWEEATRRQGQRIVVENLLKARFGTLDTELLNIIPSMLAQPTEEYTPLLLQSSREELINRFS